MKFHNLTFKNILFFSRYYQLIALATMITVAVITGSLVIGDSVRTTLVKRVIERLSDTETVIFSRNAFLDEKIMASPVFKEGSRGVLLTNGFVSQSGKLIPVFVWGINDRPISKGAARINTALHNEIGGKPLDVIVLRLPATGLVPSGSLFVTENYTTSMRLTYDGLMTVENGGHMSLKNEHAIPLNIFVNRDELAEALKTEHKLNLILSNKKITADAFSSAWDYTSSGLSVHVFDGFTEISADRIFLQEEVVATICKNNRDPNRLFSYLANAIEHENVSIPYSFITAMERYQGETLQKDDVILSDYSANRLQAKTGDRILITWFTSKDFKTLQTDSAFFRVRKIVPIAEFTADKTISAEFPGLTDVESCTDWDSDLPINMALITPEDERYWEVYRNVPKAIIAYSAIADRWSNVYGSATAVRVENQGPDLSALSADMFGIQRTYPREAGLSAAMNGVDFSGLFLALGIFMIIAAILLMVVPLSEMLTQRKQEIALLHALGYSRQRIVRLLWSESAPVVLLASLTGVIVGILYTALIMWLLGTIWKGATHTEGFSVYPGMVAISIGTILGISLSLWILRRTIVRHLKISALSSEKKRKKPSNDRIWFVSAILSTLLAVLVTGANFLFLHSAILFMLIGLVLLTTATLWGHYFVCRNGSVFTEDFHSKKMVWASLYANKKQAILSFFTLAAGVFIVFSVGLNRQGFENSSNLRSGTGGFTLWGESAVSIYHNMSTPAGREKLSLTRLPSDTEVLQCLRLDADDASCLNLNKVSAPNVLGIAMAMLSESDFQIMQNSYALDGKEAFKQLQHRNDTVYPALVDATVLTWSLNKRLGDTLYYENDKGQTVAIQLVGTLPNTIFQGHILIDRHHFSEIWEETTGSNVFLIKTAESDTEGVKSLLMQALNEYGVRITTTNDRLKLFNTVTDTYLTIFMTLGGVGLLLGLMSFIIVVRKSLTARRKEIEFLKILGFSNEKIEQTLTKENRLVPLYAITTGIVSALAGIGINIPNISAAVWITALFFTICIGIGITLFVKKSVRKIVINDERH